MKVHEVTFHNTRDVKLTSTEMKEKPLAPNEVLLATEYSVVSAGTELAIWRGTESWKPLPCVPGYGAVGVVQKVGNAVQRCAAGDRIFCYAAHRSLSVIDDSMVVRVPDDVPAHLAVVARMGQVAFTSVRVSDVELGDTVAVLGLGLVGNLASQLMKLAGATVKRGYCPTCKKKGLSKEKAGVALGSGFLYRECQYCLYLEVTYRSPYRPQQ